jgi:hypothetical protein
MLRSRAFVLAIVALLVMAVKEGAMRSEEDIRQMSRHLQGLVLHYRNLYDQATARGDIAAAEVASLKEVSYLSAAEMLAWALGEVEANFEQAEVVIVRTPRAKQVSE